MLRRKALPGWKEDDLGAERVKLSGATFGYSCDLKASRLVEDAAGLTILDPAPLAGERRTYDAETRATAIDLRYPRMVHSQIEVDLPAGSVLRQGPGLAKRSESFGEFRVLTGQAGGRVIRTADLVLSQSRIPATSYAQLRAFFSAYVDEVTKKLAIGPPER